MLSRKPRAGDRVHYDGLADTHLGTVTSVEGNLCWYRRDGEEKSAPFIWQFPRDGTLNRMFRIVEAA